MESNSKKYEETRKERKQRIPLRLDRVQDADAIDFLEFCKANGVNANAVIVKALTDWISVHAFDTIEDLKYLTSK